MCCSTAKCDSTCFKCPLHVPVSVEHLLVLCKSLDLSTPFHATVWALALTCFFGCCHLGELTIPSKDGANPCYHVMGLTGVSFSHLREAHLASFNIPWTKMTQEEGAKVIVMARSDSKICPVNALFIHLKFTNHSCPFNMPLFSYCSSSGVWIPMVKRTFLDFCDAIWKAAGLEHILEHSFRIGGTVELLLAGVNLDVITAKGGWTSLAFLLHWHHMEEIILLSTSCMYKKSHINSLASLFEEFCVQHGIPCNFLSEVHSLD